jgi:fumarate reductase subunit C
MVEIFCLAERSRELTISASKTARAVPEATTAKVVPTYVDFHPRWYRRRVSVYWWLGEWRYLKFILRELSSVFVAVFVVITLFQLHALRNGPEAYARFQHWLETPAAITLNVISFFFVLLHTITWFNLAPRAMPIRVRGKRLPDFLVAAPNYALWLGVSSLVAWLVLR